VNNSEASFETALIISELDRRHYLYLIGGDYEKLFYTFSEDNEGKSQMERIRLDIEVSEAERQSVVHKDGPDAEYQKMLDYLLKARVKKAIGREGNLINQCDQLTQLGPLLQSLGAKDMLSEKTLSIINDLAWLKSEVSAFLALPGMGKLFGVNPSKDPIDQIQQLPVPYFYWLLPRFIAENLSKTLHSSLKLTFEKLRLFSRIMSGAIACLSVKEKLAKEDKWQLYMMASISLTPMTLLISILNNEVQKLIQAQQNSLGSGTNKESRELILKSYQVNGEILHETFNIEEFIRPHVLESLALDQFDHFQFLLGVSDSKDRIANIYHQARAYSFYRQLFKTGRIRTHETAIFLKKYNISREMMLMLNEHELSDFKVHVSFLKQMLAH